LEAIWKRSHRGWRGGESSDCRHPISRLTAAAAAHRGKLIVDRHLDALHGFHQVGQRVGVAESNEPISVLADGRFQTPADKLAFMGPLKKDKERAAAE